MRQSDVDAVIGANLKDDRVEGYYVFNTVPWSGSWLQHDSGWGPFRTARLFFFFNRADKARLEATTTGMVTFVLAKMIPNTRKY